MRRTSDGSNPLYPEASNAALGAGRKPQVTDAGSMNDLWIESYIRSTNWKPQTRGFTINGQTGYAEFADVFISGEIQAALGTIGGVTIGEDYLQSSNYVSGVSGWRLDSSGTAEFQNINIGRRIISVDTTQSISDTIDELEALGGGIIELAPGTHTVSSLLTVRSSNIEIRGTSPTNTIIDLGTSGRIYFIGSTEYSTGQIAGISNSVFVTGTGTSWLANVTAGQHLFLNNQYYKIAAVTSDTTLVLSEGYGGSLTFPQSYAINEVIENTKISDVRFTGGDNMRALSFSKARKTNLYNVELIDATSTINPALQITSCGEVSLNKVLVVGSADRGIEVIDSSLMDWSSVNVFSSDDDGIYLENVSTASFQPVASSSNGGEGILVYGCQDIILVASCQNNSGGITVRDNGTVPSSGVVIKSSSVRGSSGAGISIRETSKNTRISGCEMTGNNYGLAIGEDTYNDTTGTIVTGNIIIDNESGQLYKPEYARSPTTFISNNYGIDDSTPPYYVRPSLDSAFITESVTVTVV